nr:unnamed protein product [Callosobruchus chinensis]
MKHFIECVREFECLWKTDAPDYKNVEVKDEAWSKIVQDCGLTDAREAKSLWKKLRDGHRQALHRKKPTHGQNLTNDRPWKYEELMKFLIPHIGNRRPRSANPFDRSSPATLWMPQDVKDELLGEPEVELFESTSIKQEPIEDSSVLQIDAPSTASVNKRKSVELLHAESSITSRAKLSEEPPRKASALDLFFKSMHESTSELPDHLQMKVQRKIFDAVMAAKEEHLEDQGTRKRISYGTDSPDCQTFSPTNNETLN